MDIGAHLAMSDFEPIAKRNNIMVPRTRGYRLMKNEPALTEEEIQANIQALIIEEAIYFFNIFGYNNVGYRKKSVGSLIDKYLVYEAKYNDQHELESITYKEVRWENIRGKKKKNFKMIIKKKIKKLMNQIEVWNNYAGKEGILYIHARIGGYNWDYFGGSELEKEDWFIEKVDDQHDPSYCDIYARINGGN